MKVHKKHVTGRKNNYTLDAYTSDATDTSIQCLNKQRGGGAISQKEWCMLMIWEYEQHVPYSWSLLRAKMEKTVKRER